MNRSAFLLRLPLAVLLLSLVGLGAGCTSVRLSDDQIGQFKVGFLEVTVDHGFDAAYQATKRALGDQKLFITQDDKKESEAELMARASDDTRVIVKIKGVAPGRTHFKIRWGLQGNLAESQRIYDGIRKRL